MNYALPPKGLLQKILKRIHKEERFLVFRRVILFSITLAASLIAFVPSLNMLSADFTQSGFLHFFSLVFSDWQVATSYWQSFALVLLQTLPAASLALFLAVLLVFLQSFKSLVKNIKVIKNGKQHIRVQTI